MSLTYLHGSFIPCTARHRGRDWESLKQIFDSDKNFNARQWKLRASQPIVIGCEVKCKKKKTKLRRSWRFINTFNFVFTFEKIILNVIHYIIEMHIYIKGYMLENTITERGLRVNRNFFFNPGTPSRVAWMDLPYFVDLLCQHFFRTFRRWFNAETGKKSKIDYAKNFGETNHERLMRVSNRCIIMSQDWVFV